jgi:hypothetical protein
MELTILLPDQSARAAIHLKEFLDSEYIDGLDKTEVNRTAGARGEMGGEELLGSITAVIHALQKPLVELVKALQKYVDTFLVTIVIPTPHGEVKLKKGGRMSAKELENLITSIQKAAKE